MSTDSVVYNVEVSGEYITVKWMSSPNAIPLPRYPELEFRFDYMDISADTVRAMLRDMEVPDPLANAVMTRITAGVS